LTDRAGLLALRVRVSNQKVRPPTPPAAFPEFSSGREQCPRLQLRGSAGFTPASLSLPSGKDARPVCHDKDQLQPLDSNG